MSELISQIELLRLMVDGRKPAQRAFRETGLDVELFERIYKLFRPGFDYLHGLQNIEKYFESPPLRTDWLLMAAKLDELSLQVVRVAEMGISDGFRGHLPLIPSVSEIYHGEQFGTYANMRYVLIDVYLTRRGQWLVWTNYPNSQYQLVWQEDVVKTIESFVPNGMSLRTLSPAPRPKFNASQSVPLVLADGLARVFRDSIELKKKRITLDELSLGSADNILNGIADY